jgi:hypothetical protein
MKRSLALLLAVVVAGAVLAAPAAAKKPSKRPRPAPAPLSVKYFLADHTPDGETCTELVLALAPSEKSSACGSVYSGAAHEAAGDPCSGDSALTVPCGEITYDAAEGLPVTLDARRKVTGLIVVLSQGDAEEGPVVSEGTTTFHIRLRGVFTDVERELGTFSADYEVTRDKVRYEVPFELALPAERDGAQLTGFAVDMWNSGETVLHGHYQVNESYLVMPAREAPAP